MARWMTNVVDDELHQFTSLFKDLMRSLGNVKSWFRKHKRRGADSTCQDDAQSLDGYVTAAESLYQKLESDLSATDLTIQDVVEQTSEQADGGPGIDDSSALPSSQSTDDAQLPVRLKIEDKAISEPEKPAQEDNAIPQPEQLPQFALFSLLPPEIRALIWKYALPSPRIVEILLPNRWGNFVLPNNPPPPAIRSVCRESRAEALRYVNVRSLAPLAPYLRTYLDASADLFFWNVGYQMGWQRCLLKDVPSVFRDLRCMAFLGSCLLHSRDMKWLVEVLSKCIALEEVTLLYTSVRRRTVNKVDANGRREVQTLIGPGCLACLGKVDYSETLKTKKLELESEMKRDKRFKEAGRNPPKVMLKKMWVVKDVK